MNHDSGFLLLILVVSSFLCSKGCHVYKHFEDEEEDDEKRRKKRELSEELDLEDGGSGFGEPPMLNNDPTPADNEEIHISNMRMFFNSCIQERLNTNQSFITEVDFVILDSLWFLISDRFFCKESSDSAECWSRTIEELIVAGKIRDKAQECIHEYADALQGTDSTSKLTQLPGVRIHHVMPEYRNSNSSLAIGTARANLVARTAMSGGREGGGQTHVQNSPPLVLLPNKKDVTWDYREGNRVSRRFHAIYNLVDKKYRIGHLKCWKCINEESNESCLKNGRIEACDINEDSCENVVRVYHQKVTITKRCKQKRACRLSKFIESRQPYMKSSAEKCNLDEPGTVCRCCCYSDGCNYDALYCYQQKALSPESYVDSSLSPYADIYPSTKEQLEEQIVFSACLQNKTQMTDRGVGTYDMQRLTSFIQTMTIAGNREGIPNFNHRTWYSRFATLTAPQRNLQLRQDIQRCVEEIYYYPEGSDDDVSEVKTYRSVRGSKTKGQQKMETD